MSFVFGAEAADSLSNVINILTLNILYNYRGDRYIHQPAWSPSSLEADVFNCEVGYAKSAFGKSQYGGDGRSQYGGDASARPALGPLRESASVLQGFGGAGERAVGRLNRSLVW